MTNPKLTLKGLHDAVRSHTRMILPRSLVSYFYTAVWKKQENTLSFQIHFITKFQISLKCVLIFLSLWCSLVSLYHLNQKFLDILLCFPYKIMSSGNQYGGHKCDGLQNWLHMTSHEKPLLCLHGV